MLSILVRKRVGVADFVNLAGLEAKIGAFITELNEVAPSVEWTSRSLDEALASIDDEFAAHA